MNTNKNELSGEESLKIITQMIHQAKGRMTEASFHFILWGWIVIVASIAHYYLIVYTDYGSPHIVWLISIPGWILSFYHSYKSNSKKNVVTYSDNLILWTWIAFSFCILIIIFAGGLINYHITPLILVMSAFATFITGLIIRFKPMIIGGSTFWLFAPLAFYVGPVNSQLVIAVAVITGYLIPAYMLKYNKNNDSI